jgi:nucleotide-binding universal stress UspA family protein
MSKIEPTGSRRIVVGIDGSDSSLDALDWAADEAAASGAELRAVTAYGAPSVLSGFALPEPYLADIKKDGQRVLDDAVARVRAHHPSLKATGVLAKGSAVEVLLKMAASAGLLVVGCRGRGAFTGRLVGSVSQPCVGHAACAVAVVHARPSVSNGARHAH